MTKATAIRRIESSPLASTDSERTKLFADLYREYAAMVRSLVFRICGNADPTDDLVQESFLKIWQALPKFRGDASPKTWIYRITINTTLAWLRRHKRQKLNEAASNEQTTETAASPERQTINKELTLQLLNHMSPEHRTVLVLHVFDELSVNEIADILEVPPGTVKSRLFKAREFARDWLAARQVKL